MASIEAAALRRGSPHTPARTLDSAVLGPLGDASSFTTLSRRHRAALIAEAEENASALWRTSQIPPPRLQRGFDALSRCAN